MAEVLTIGGVDRTANLYRDSLRIEQAAGEFTAVCSFKLNDLDSTLNIQTRDPVAVTDNGTTLFAGEVVDIDYDLLSLALPGRRMSIRCQDYNILVEEAVIDGEEAYSAQADSAIIADLFASYRPDVDAVTYVSTLQASMTISFQDVTLRQALSDICSRSGGRWYVDEARALHYFTAETNVCAWWLSDSPDNVNSFPYQDIKQRLSASTIVNRILVVGKEVRGWYEDAASVVAYGERPAVAVDNRITTAAGLDARGAALLAKWANPRIAYDVVTRKAGLRAGMDVRLICGDWGIDETLTVRRLTISWRGDNRFYALEIGEGIAPALTTGRIWLERLGQAESSISSIDDTVFDTDAPATPTFEAGNLTTGVDIDADGHQVVYIQTTWGSVADTDLDHYQIQISTSNDFSGYTITRDQAAGGDRKERFVGILGNTTYYARVRAIDWVGNKSAWSAVRNVTTARDTTAPAQVAGLVAAGSRTLIGINWTANTEADLKHYEIQRAPDVAGAPGAWSTIALARLNFYIDQDFTDGEIADQDTFWYRVRAADTSGNDGDWAAETSAALSQIGSDHIAALSITTAKLAAGAVTAEKITVAQLSAITADLGTITAGVVTGATIRTAAVGARVVLDSTDGLQCYNSDGTLCAQLDVDGSGQIGASDLEVPPLTWNNLGQFNRIQANQLEMGSMFFNRSEGLLLLNDYCPVTATSWASLRKQAATISGAFHQVAGRWLGTRALMIEEGTTNLCTNPSIETNTTSWSMSGGSLAQSSDCSVFGSYSLKVTPAAGVWEGAIYNGVTMTSGQSYVASAWVKGIGGVTYYIGLYDTVAATYVGSLTQFTGTGEWQRVATVPGVAAGNNLAYLYIRKYNNASTDSYYVDGVQIEQKPYETSYCDGSFGAGYSWSGVAHASISSRTLTECNLDTHANVCSGNDMFSVRIVAQAPYNSTDAWSSPVYPILWCIHGADVNNYAYLRYLTGVGFNVHINNGDRIVQAATFSQGDWLDLVITFDFSNDVYNLYMNGELLGTSTAVLTAPTVTEMNLGALYNGAYTWDGPFAEFAVFDKALSAAEVAQLYNLQRPLVDGGGLETPGIYIVDGKFKIASSLTGNRIEITADEVAGYDSGGTKQFYIQASDGKALAGGGAVALDEDGITIGQGSNSANKIEWDFSGTIRASIWARLNGAQPELNIDVGPPTGTNPAIIEITAYDGAQQTGLYITQSTFGGGSGSISLLAENATRLYAKDHGIKLVGDIRLTDGVAEPAVEGGYAILYVDAADGNLWVKFGDGVKHIIAVDF